MVCCTGSSGVFCAKNLSSRRTSNMVSDDAYDDDYDDVVRYFEDSSEEEKSDFRKVLREGKDTFTPKALASLRAKGLTEEDAIAIDCQGN